MYHLELRHFPHSAWRFNLSEQDLAAIVQPWVREQVVDVGERKWSPHLANLTILEGPKLDVTELSMGRGWRSAQRRCEDVTQRVLDQALQGAASMGDVPPVATAAPMTQVGPGAEPAVSGSQPTMSPASSPVLAAPAGTPGASALSDPVALGVQLAALLGPDPMALLDAWLAAAAGSPGLAPSDSLALAERAIRRASGDSG